MLIGTIVKSNSHISYLCRVYGRLDTENVPPASAYAFGTFVALSPPEGSTTRLIGVVRDTVLLNPEYGNLGPRLSPDRDLAVFSPDYLNEKGVLVDILVLGWVNSGEPHHGIPATAAQIGTRVETLDDDAVVVFHRTPNAGFLIGYLPPLLTARDPVIAELLLTVLERLEPAFPDQRRVIAVLKNNLAWKARVVPAG